MTGARHVILLLTVSLGCTTGCAPTSYVPIMWVKGTPEEIHQWCTKGALVVGRAAGCFVRTIDGCVVYAPDPPMVSKTYRYDQWATLGHEVKHCFDGKFHRG